MLGGELFYLEVIMDAKEMINRIIKATEDADVQELEKIARNCEQIAFDELIRKVNDNEREIENLRESIRKLKFYGRK